MKSVVTKQPPARVPTAQAPVASNIISIISSDDDENEIPAPRSVSTESVENDDIIFQHNEISSSPLKRTSAALYSSDDEDRDPCFSTGLSQPLRKQTLFDEFSDDDDDIEKLVHERRKDYGALMGTSIDDMSDGETMPLTRNGSNPVTVNQTVDFSVIKVNNGQ